jgi:hypothetical protein
MAAVELATFEVYSFSHQFEYLVILRYGILITLVPKVAAIASKTALVVSQ